MTMFTLKLTPHDTDKKIVSYLLYDDIEEKNDIDDRVERTTSEVYYISLLVHPFKRLKLLQLKLIY